MILADTSIWIEFLKGNPEYFSDFSRMLEFRFIITIDCIFGELYQGCKNSKEMKIISEYWNNLPKFEEVDLMIKAGQLSCHEKLISRGIGLIDSAIIYAARVSNSRIWTLDNKLMSVLKRKEIFNS